jgi:hypothetical protein
MKINENTTPSKLSPSMGTFTATSPSTLLLLRVHGFAHFEGRPRELRILYCYSGTPAKMTHSPFVGHQLLCSNTNATFYNL